MNLYSFKIMLISMIFGGMFMACQQAEVQLPAHPNIVYILADDLGYGDVSANNPDSRIATPNIDGLAAAGMRFTDAHSPSSVCTPTRYGILTGQYCWRSRLPRGVLRGYGRSIMEPQQMTVAELLQQQGYRTGVVGKWHLGLDWLVKPEWRDSIGAGAQVNELGIVTEMDPEWIDFAVPPTGGPLAHGFDESFILPASLDMDPYCYLRNDTLITMPDAYTPGSDLNTGYTGAFWRPGRMAQDFVFDQVLPNFTKEAVSFIHHHSLTADPFFLYLALAAPHTPWVPTAEYQGLSRVGAYGDFVQMVDDAVGQVLGALQESGVEEETLVIFTSDNGPFWRSEYIDSFQHRAAYHFRGMKADIWEGGHRIPFIVRWPGVVKDGTVSKHTTVLTNLLATCADLLGVETMAGQSQDSYSILPVLKGEPASPPIAIHHSSRAMFALRQGDWKYIEGRGSGGFTPPAIIDPAPGEPAGQLYHLGEDPGEQNNLWQEHPVMVDSLRQLLSEVRNQD